MSRLLSPEESKRELDGGLELEELAEKLDGQEDGENEGFDLIYRKDSRESSDVAGSVYTLKEAASDWYDSEELDEIRLDDLEIDVQEVRMNSVSGETVLVDSSGKETRYDILSTFEGTTTFTQEVGRNEYVFRYDSQEDEVRATEIGGGMEPSRWENDELKKKAELMEKMYNDTREALWTEEASDEEIRAKNSNFDQLRPVYNKVTEDIEQSEKDRSVIDKYDHVGSTRGIGILRDFKKAVRRAPADSLDNYEIDEDSKDYPIVIQEK